MIKVRLVAITIDNVSFILLSFFAITPFKFNVLHINYHIGLDERDYHYNLSDPCFKEEIPDSTLKPLTGQT